MNFLRFAVVVVEGNEYLVPEPLIKKYHPSSVVIPPTSIGLLPSLPEPSLNTHYQFSANLQSFLSGRELLLDELPFTLQELHEHYRNGYITYTRGIDFCSGNPTCTRCGNDATDRIVSYMCSRCLCMCSYCRKCIMLGRVSQCTPLIRWTGPTPQFEATETLLAWNGTLSHEQETASNQLVEAIKERTSFLIWAVCGSGKTEMLFQGIAHALSEGKNVVIAAPRTDVVIELTPRIKAAFPNTSIISLYGGSEDRGNPAQLVISTTHQLLRYRNYFDVIIVDEVDAFPYSYDKSLRFAVKKAQKDDGVTIFLTATPSTELKQIPHIKVPKRYHGYPLPIPQFEWCGHWKKQISKKSLPKNVQRWLIERSEKNKQAFLFVPTIEVGQQLVPILRELGLVCESVHAEDAQRHEKVAKFRSGDLQLLITTTILERGVTVPNIDVAVLGAEEAIFTESALVQISGRVGRHKDYPTGNITLFHYGKTTAMVEAKRHIMQMNKEAGFEG
ncbi:DEAD/DEAH box helicase [Alkalihalobacterium sp. APHAB7]|uniref:DEAD/DEAH box helicase n=1 Tax=Alkalihalobacterium sp. APHAB7 TaxID=3402081 RepID=UPI003AAD400A